MNEEMLTAIRELAMRSLKGEWYQPHEMSRQIGNNDAEFIAAMSPDIVLDLVYEIERMFEIQDVLQALRTRNHQLILESNKYCAEVSRGKSATIKMGMQLDEAQAQSDRRAALLRQYHLGHITPALIEAVEREFMLKQTIAPVHTA